MPENADIAQAGPVLSGPGRSRRFGWPMRVLLSLLLFDIVVHSLCGAFPLKDWRKEFGLESHPERLPTRQEFAQLRAAGDAALHNKVNESLVSTRDFFNPWPNAENRAKLGTWDACSRYAVAWLSSRLDLVENTVGFDQTWRMFSPNVATWHHVVRARLQYSDGSEYLVKQALEPADLTCYTRWNVEKILNFEVDVCWERGRIEECRGWCNLLSHRYARNEAGAPLTSIFLYEVRIDYPAPGEEPRAFLHHQMEMIRDHHSEKASRTFFTFNVQAGTWNMERKE
jgi:hypothetical protein